jgi:PII-like signaling protein
MLKGVMGLAGDGTVLKENSWAVAQDVPVIVEIVDGPRHVERLLATVEPALTDATVTLERAHVVLYRGGGDLGPRDLAARCDVIATRESSTAWEVKTMKMPEEGVLLRVFIGESDREKGRDRTLYEGIVHRAREAGLAGATVLKGPMGFGRHSRMHKAGLLEMSSDLPVVIEIVDSEEKVRAFLPVVDELVTEGLVTLEAVRILKYAAPGK